jgi:hypothetical protein
MKKNEQRRAFKLRTDLLDFVKDENIMEEALANLSRYKPEPLLTKTGQRLFAHAHSRRAATGNDPERGIHQARKATGDLRKKIDTAKRIKKQES